jgi:hypothetical protein
MRIEPEISGVNIILVGKFNPAIFTPAWFTLHGLLPKGTEEGAQLQVAHQQLTVFSIDWLRLEVTPDRFRAETSQAPHVRLLDLILRVFKETLPETPLMAFGINRDVHFQVQGLTARDRIGRTLAPVEPWGPWKDALGLDGIQGGMTSLTMSQIDPDGRPKGGNINVKVEPSNRIGPGGTGVYVGVNDHYVSGEATPESATRLVGLLEENFEASLRRSDGLVDHIMSLAETREV